MDGFISGLAIGTILGGFFTLVAMCVLIIGDDGRR